MIKLPPLPFSSRSLVPYMSKETLDFHYQKHHKNYVAKLNQLIKGTEWEKTSLEQLIKLSPTEEIFNNAAQVWNHNFFWQCLSPKGGGNPSGVAGQLIKDQFGSFKNFKKKFETQALSNFGSGWTWVVIQNNKLEILNSSNAKTPLGYSLHPVLTLDVWEHAYYIDHRNERKKFINSFWHLVNWEFINQQIENQGV